MKRKIILTIMISIMLMLTLTGCGAKVSSLSVHGQTMEFEYGQNFSIGSNAVVTAHLDDGTLKTLSAGEYEVDYSAYNKMSPGTYIIKVSYKEDKKIAFTYDVKVKQMSAASIEMSQIESPILAYYVDDEIDLSVGKIMVTYVSGMCVELDLDSEGVVVTGFDSSVVTNSQIISVSYLGQTTSYSIMIAPKSASTITIKELPKKNYYVGDSIDLNKGSINVTYVNGKQAVLPLTSSEVTISGFDTSKSTPIKVVTISHAGKSITYIITVDKPILQRIELTPPTKTNYFEGQDLDYTGASILATYNNGTKTIYLNDDGVVVSGFNSSTAVDNQVVTVSFGGLSKTFTVNIIRKVATSISVIEEPRLNYYLGETLDLTDGMLKVNYNDGSEDNVSLDNIAVSVSGFDSSDVMENQVLTISYDGQTTTMKVNILQKVVSRLEIVTLPTKVDYFVGQSLQLDGLEVVAYHQLGSDNVDLINLVATGFNSNTPMENQVITITYMGVSTTFNVNIVEKSAISMTFQIQPITQYYVNDDINLSVGNIFIEYDDGSNELIALNDARVNVSGFNSQSAVKDQLITVDLDGRQITYRVNIYVKEIERIVIGEPNKLEYFVGETLDLTGLTITAIYPLGQEIIDLQTADYEVVGFDSRWIVSGQIITVSYLGKTANFTVNIIEKVVQSVLVNDDVKTRYFVGDSLDVTAGTIKVYYSNGVSEELALKDLDVTITGFSSESVLSGMELTLTYEGKSDTFLVNVVEPQVIQITLEGVTRVYYTGDEFDGVGVLTLHLENGSTISGDMSSVKAIDFDTSVADSNYELKLCYNDLFTVVEVEIIELVVEKIEVSVTRSVYVVGEKFNEGSITITATANKGEYEVALDDVQIVDFDTSVESTKVTVSVIYKNVSTTFDIEVISETIQSIEVYTLPRVKYYKDDNAFNAWDLTGGVLLVKTSLGAKVYIDMSSSAVTCSTDFDLSQSGEKEITLNYAGAQVSFTIEIFEPIIAYVMVYTNYDNEYYAVRANDGSYAVSISGELVDYVDVAFNNDWFTFNVETIENEVDFTICVNIYENEYEMQRQILINVTNSDFDYCVNLMSIMYGEENITINNGVGEFDTTASDLSKLSAISSSIRYIEIDNQLYTNPSDCRLGNGVNNVVLYLGGDVITKVNLTINKVENLIEVYTLDGVDYEVDSVSKFEFNRGSEHTLSFVYDNESYIALIDDIEYVSSTYKFMVTRYLNNYNDLYVNVYDRVEYQNYKNAYSQYEDRLKDYYNGIISVMPIEPDGIEVKQSFEIEIGICDYIENIEVVTDSQTLTYETGDGYTYIEVDDFIKSFNINANSPYTVQTTINGESDGVLYYGKNDIKAYIYNNDKLLAIKNIELEYLPREVDNVAVFIDDINVLNTGNIVYEYNQDELQLNYNVVKSNTLDFEIYYNNLNNKRKTIKYNYEGWFNYDNGINNMYFALCSKLGSKVYFKVDILVYEFNQLTVSGNDFFGSISDNEEEEYARYQIDINNVNVVEISKSKMDTLTIVRDSDGQALNNVSIEWLYDGKILRLVYSDTNNIYEAIYFVKYKQESDITDYKLYIIDGLNKTEIEVDTSDVISVTNGQSIVIETLDSNASVVCTDESKLSKISDKIYMVNASGEFEVTFIITPSSGLVSKALNVKLNFSVALVEMFSVDFGNNNIYKAFQGAIGFDGSSDFKLTFVETNNNGANVNYTATAIIDKDLVNIWENNNEKYAKVDIEHINDDNQIAISLNCDDNYLTSLQNVDLKVKINNHKEYIEFYYDLESVKIRVVILLNDIESEFVFTLGFGGNSVTKQLAYLDERAPFGDFVSMNIGGITYVESTITSHGTIDVPATIDASITLGEMYTISFANSMEEGEFVLGDVVQPENYNNLTLNVLTDGEFSLIIAVVNKMDSTLTSVKEQYVFIIAMSNEGSSYMMSY